MSKTKFIGNYSNNLKIGVIGTTNVGKSTLFNILSKCIINPAVTSLSLFTTVDPNMCIFTAKDPQFQHMVTMFQPQTESPSKLTLIDTPGIVAGAYHEKNGLGMSGLKCLRKADVLIHVLREYADSNVCHYEGSVDPVRDLLTVNQELLIYDLHTIEASIMEIETIMLDRMGGEHLTFQHNTLLKAWAHVAGELRPVTAELAAMRQALATGSARPKSESGGVKFRKARLPKICRGRPIRCGMWDHHQSEFLSSFNLLTAKPVIHVVNMTSRDYLRNKSCRDIIDRANDQITANTTSIALGSISADNDDQNSFKPNASVSSFRSDHSQAFSQTSHTSQSQQPPLSRSAQNSVIITEMTAISLEFEEKLLNIERSMGGRDELADYFAANPTHVSSVDAIIRNCYQALNLIRFYTCTDKEVRCHLLRLGSTVIDASALVDVRIARSFIRADVIAYEDYAANGGDKLRVRMAGKLKSETRKYVVNDGDIVEFFSHEMSSGSSGLTIASEGSVV